VIFRAICKRLRNRCHFREWLATKSLAGYWLESRALVICWLPGLADFVRYVAASPRSE
jgi:hypothetical protein